ncbi:MAG: hypothetical protein Hyperionvirus34_20 [Hyperionvirus sp.]|uniref:Uncharacterized protein n=1 Tax=Hyperionvirus sp. TaxID=2487770 RepID=A0A3G5ABW0_9VIRU|nr:MAG: hypothetical protein Hyperionvirus34_20 [Hyperionvirus sp.]
MPDRKKYNIIHHSEIMDKDSEIITNKFCDTITNSDPSFNHFNYCCPDNDSIIMTDNFYDFFGNSDLYFNNFPNSYPNVLNAQPEKFLSIINDVIQRYQSSPFSGPYDFINDVDVVVGIIGHLEITEFGVGFASRVINGEFPEQRATCTSFPLPNDNSFWISIYLRDINGTILTDNGNMIVLVEKDNIPVNGALLLVVTGLTISVLPQMISPRNITDMTRVRISNNKNCR